MFGSLTKIAVEKRLKIDQANKALKLKMFEQLKINELYLSNDIPVPLKIQLEYYEELLTLYRSMKKTLPEIAYKKELYKQKIKKVLNAIIIPLLLTFTGLGTVLFSEIGLAFTILICGLSMMLTFIIITFFVNESEKSFDKKMISSFSK